MENMFCTIKNVFFKFKSIKLDLTNELIGGKRNALFNGTKEWVEVVEYEIHRVVQQ